MKSLNQTKPENQVETAIISGFFCTDNKPVNFVKKTNTRGYILEERFRGIILYPLNETDFLKFGINLKLEAGL